MPLIYSTEGIKIYIYYNDHLPPYFHALYAEYEAMIAIETLEVIKGKMPKTQLKKVLAWAEANKELLMTAYKTFNPKHFE
jgi:hypothetical protein